MLFLQVGADTLGSAAAVLAGLGGHAGGGRGHHHPGPALQASAQNELVEPGPALPGGRCEGLQPTGHTGR